MGLTIPCEEVVFRSLTSMLRWKDRWSVGWWRCMFAWRRWLKMKLHYI
jgi:hypothetical protein